jgi:hypothetical protein
MAVFMSVWVICDKGILVEVFLSVYLSIYVCLSPFVLLSYCYCWFKIPQIMAGSSVTKTSSLLTCVCLSVYLSMCVCLCLSFCLTAIADSKFRRSWLGRRWWRRPPWWRLPRTWCSCHPRPRSRCSGYSQGSRRKRRCSPRMKSN